MDGLKSLNRSSDAILSYSEETGTPIFTIDTSLMLSNLTFKSGAKGQVWSKRNYFKEILCKSFPFFLL